MTDVKTEVLTKIQALHDIIEQHPYLSGMVTDAFHGHLDYVVKNAHELDDIEKAEWRKKPSDEMQERYL